jgi:hypothetical protein
MHGGTLFFEVMTRPRMALGAWKPQFYLADFAIVYGQLLYLHFLFEKGLKLHTGEVGEWLKPIVC